ncbi:EF-P 5-aminopentanol modification-associated protein YfmF [Rummeliibacillus suwonensis]|uniref:EF-P 5-aminopentanol modification-associated protein YfmF n=1 Tax=Rummeliibacillus suwonensis TaxID=1306154 RepID=UPI0028994ABA|nr:pitrilysin family protein [Rummeliibacillus suwonensis]
MFNTLEVAKDVHIHTRVTDQFKTVNFSLKLRRPLKVEEAAERTVLTNVLQHSNAQFPSTASMRMYLDDLYGTVLYLDTSKKGNEHVVILNVETVNDQYLKNSDVLSKVLELMHTVLFEPNFENGTFKENIVAREKEMVKERIQSIFDDKSRYAQNRLTKILAPNHPASISANGTIPDVEAITLQSLTDTYQRMLAEDVVDIYVVGDIDETKMVEELKKALPFGDRKSSLTITEIPKIQPTDTYVKEKQDMKQGKLHIGFSTPVFFKDVDFPKMQIFNGIFGGYPHSKLFMNVREKESMAYYCSSSYSAQYGLVYVMSGIDVENEKRTLQLIDEQLLAMQQGEITDLEMTQTKAMLQNQLKEALDSARGQIEIYDQYKDLDEDFNVEAWQTKWQAVTKEDVVVMAKQLHKETVYFLSGMEDEK